MNFAKLYEDEELGQILCKIDEDNDDSEEELRVFFDPKMTLLGFVAWRCRVRQKVSLKKR